jgi:hypothetical protein
MGSQTLDQLYLLPPEAAQVLRCSQRTLARMRAEGRGPRFHKHAGRILYSLEWLHEWVEQGTRTPVRSHF